MLCEWEPNRISKLVLDPSVPAPEVCTSIAISTQYSNAQHSLQPLASQTPALVLDFLPHPPTFLCPANSISFFFPINHVKGHCYNALRNAIWNAFVLSHRNINSWLSCFVECFFFFFWEAGSHLSRNEISCRLTRGFVTFHSSPS